MGSNGTVANENIGRWDPCGRNSLGIAVIWNKKRRPKTTTKPKKGCKTLLRHNCLWSAGSPFLKDSYFHCCCGGTRWTQTGTDALGAFTHHTKKNHTPNLRCFFLQPTTTTANDGHVAINRSKLARAFSCESALRSLLAKKRWFRRRIRDARGKRKSERSYYTHARRHKTQQLATETRKSSGIYDLHTQTRNTQTG